jgi:ligand-binding SRPBCC domain-containing protein
VPTIVIETWIDASPQRCFDAARDLDLHVESLAHTGERAVGGRISGLIGLHEEVTWRGRHFGIVQHFTSKITAFDPPVYFQDTMQRGAFKTFVHDHFFTASGNGTVMKDVLVFTAPLGILGRVAEYVVLKGYLERLLRRRAATLKTSIEGQASGRNRP